MPRSFIRVNSANVRSANACGPLLYIRILPRVSAFAALVSCAAERCGDVGAAHAILIIIRAHISMYHNIINTS